MRRQQIFVFIVLFIIALIPVFLSENANLALTRSLSSVLLFPVRITANIMEYLRISSARMEKLEILVNRLALENAVLRDSLNLDTTQLTTSELLLVKASVIGRDPSNINGYIHIDKGLLDRVKVDQPVISVDGFVGKIRDVGPTGSIVETIENQGFTVSAIDVNTGIHGVVRNQMNLLFDYVRHSDTINIGDSVLTSGMSEIFPKGILIGTVHRITESDDLFFQQVYIAPAAQINRLASVYIIISDMRPTTPTRQ